MKRLMCLSLLFLLGAGLFATRGFASDVVNILDLGPAGHSAAGTASTGLGALTADGTGNGAGYNSSLASAAWAEGSVFSNATLGTADDSVLAIGSSAAVRDTAYAMGNLVVTGADNTANVFTTLSFGGIWAAGDAMQEFSRAGNEFSATFGTVLSKLDDGTPLALEVYSGGKARSITIADLTAKTAAVQGDLATGNALELTRLEIVSAAGTVSSKAIGGNSTLTIGELVRNQTSAANTDAVGFAITSVGSDKIGKIILANDFTLGGTNKDTVTFTSGTGAGDAAAVLEARGNLTLSQLGANTSPANGGDLAFSTAGKGLIAVAKNLTINTLDGGSLAGVDVRADGSAVINNAADAAATLTLGDSFTANDITVNGSGTAANTLTITVDESLKSGLATLDDPATADVDEAAFTANTITLNGNASGVVLTGAGAAASKVDASLVRVVGGGNTAATNNKITSLDVRGELVVGTADAPAYLTVTTSNLRNLTQNRGVTTFDGAVAVDGMTTISGKDSTNTGTVAVSNKSTFGAGITVNTGGVLQGAADGATGLEIVLGRNASPAQGTEGQAGYVAARDAVTGELILNGGTITGVGTTSADGFRIRVVDATASTDGTLARMLVRGSGNTITGGMVDASTLDLTMDAGAGLTINDGATLLVRNAVQSLQCFLEFLEVAAGRGNF